MTRGGAGIATAGADPATAKIYLLPGQWAASATPATITTILGSCVAVCFWDAELRIGGMNHYMLPYETGRMAGSPRFGDVAIRQLLTRLVALGARPATLQATVVGGACVMDAFRRDGDHIGARNAELAERMLAAHGIRLRGRDVGGSRGRKLSFETDTGDVRVRPVGAP